MILVEIINANEKTLTLRSGGCVIILIFKKYDDCKFLPKITIPKLIEKRDNKSKVILTCHPNCPCELLYPTQYGKVRLFD
jgi:hypothetical protein